LQIVVIEQLIRLPLKRAEHDEVEVGRLRHRNMVVATIVPQVT
jgi:hypothetical protein